MKGLILIHNFPNEKRFAHFVDGKYVTDQFIAKLSVNIITQEIGGNEGEYDGFNTLQEWVDWAARNLGLKKDEAKENILRLERGDTIALDSRRITN